MKKNFYYILGLIETASILQIKEAYRKLSKKVHPDINQGDKFFEEYFKQIQEAYETLSNQEKKNKYDFDFINNLDNKNKLINDLRTNKANLESKIREQANVIFKVANANEALTKDLGIISRELSFYKEREIHFEKRIDELSQAIKKSNGKESLLGNKIIELEKEIKNTNKTLGLTSTALYIIAIGIFLAFHKNYISFGESDKKFRKSEEQLEEKYTLLKQRFEKVSKHQPFFIDSIDFFSSNMPKEYGNVFQADNLTYIHPRLKIIPLTDTYGKQPIFVKYFDTSSVLYRNPESSPYGFTFSDTLRYHSKSDGGYIHLTGWGNEKKGIYSLGKHTVQFYNEKGKLLGESFFYVE